MFRKITLCVLAALTLCCPVLAAEVDCDTTYEFQAEDFAVAAEPLRGICITGLPAPETGTILLGTRVLRKGDILSADQMEQLTFHPLRSETDATATVQYLPIYENRVDTATTLSISIRGKEELAPVVESTTLETYKNLPNKGKLNATDPEGQTLIYTVVRQPKRGTVTIHADGSFVYTPKKNKVGTDTFTFTATDPAGKVSKEATVTVRILKPTSGKQYADTVGLDCRFAAEWLRNTGLFVGETVSGRSCFYPEKAVSQGEFLAMMVKALEIPTKDTDHEALSPDTPQWLRPYLTAALRSGLTAGLETEFSPNAPITGAEAAVMLQNALDLAADEQVLAQVMSQDIPQWAQPAIAVLAHNGICLDATAPLTRAEVAQMLYRADYLSLDAPGMKVIRKQQ